MMSTWIFVFIAATSWAIIDGLRKRISLAWHPWQLLAALHFFQLPILLGFWQLSPGDGSTVAWSSYLVPGLSSLALNIAANIMFLEAVKRSPLGLTVPYLALTPLVAAIAALFFGYGLSLWGWSGILILTLGTIWLHPHDPRHGLMTPILRLKEEPGSGLMVIVALAWGFTAILDQSAVQHIPPALHALILAVGMFTAGVLGFYQANRKQKDTYPSVLSPWVLGTGAMMAIAMVAQFEAFMRIDVAVVEAVKRIIGTTSAVILGVIFYGEKEFTRRLIASALMGVGAAILVLSL